jgi:hypothetical protein
MDKKMTNLKENLLELSNICGVIGLKQSFEDEGVFLEDVVYVKRLTEVCNLLSFVKIGGCEAKTDIHNCKKLDINGIIAPMIETPFAMSKFVNCSPEKDRNFIVIESKTAYQNIDEILLVGENKISGVVVGRSDLTKSYEMDKKETDSEFIYSITESVLLKAKQYNLITTLGGNISTKSSEFIKNMFEKKLLDRIETRNVVIGLNENNIENVETVIKKALDFEILILQKKYTESLACNEDYKKRMDLLDNRK